MSADSRRRAGLCVLFCAALVGAIVVYISRNIVTVPTSTKVSRVGFVENVEILDARPNVRVESVDTRPPSAIVNRRGVILLVSGLAWCVLILASGRCADRGWRWTEMALVASAFSGLTSALILWCLTTYRWSWGWWL